MQELMAESKPQEKKRKSKSAKIISIPADALEEFINSRVFVRDGPILDKIETVNVFDRCWRINAWTKTFGPERVVASYDIKYSWFVELTDNGSIVDLTRYSKGDK